MQSEPQVSDPSDWPAGFSKLGELDSHLRCPICREFLRGAVMLNCHHTFCSACLRRHLDKESACPACRESANTAWIRRNVALEEVANCFVDCREPLLKTVQDSIKREKKDQELLEARSGKNGHGDRNDDDMTAIMATVTAVKATAMVMWQQEKGLKNHLHHYE
ncbi:E3 ubiquitin-protein ligase rad18 [Actinomortierella ambigua]|uniref:Postreplication repair E3 ubiquitin-protein ligase RAD18 n=1 Tax=Actinomortierella ambigua TaxID=1343610 RepID=A0A9P6Q6F5_9FUNG|nr:E3 ubiquitin-protein ligase rad18 [Actinomortierella ambigua]